jgi:hypothetical protein
MPNGPVRVELPLTSIKAGAVQVILSRQQGGSGRSPDPSSTALPLVGDALDSCSHLFRHSVVDHVTSPGDDVQVTGRQLLGEGDRLVLVPDDTVGIPGHDLHRQVEAAIPVAHGEGGWNHEGSFLSRGADLGGTKHELLGELGIEARRDRMRREHLLDGWPQDQPPEER